MQKRSNPSAVYDIVKFIAVLLVVFAHSTRMYTSVGAFHPMNQSLALAKITEYIYIFHMPLFMFVSGAVYGLCIEKGKYKDKIKFVSNKAKRLIIPYYVFGFMYVAPVMCLTGVTDKDYFSYCLDGIIWSLDSRHLWFLLSLFIIFIFVICLRDWFLKSHYTRIGILFMSGIAYIFAKYMPSRLQIGTAFSYQFFFVLGVELHFLYHYAEAIFLKCKYFLVVLPILLLGNFFYNPNSLVSCFYKLVGILMIIMLAVLLEQKTEIMETKFFKCIKETAMGIYLLHPMLIYLGYYFLGQRDIPPVVLCVGIAIASLYISVIMTKTIRLLRLGFILGDS